MRRGVSSSELEVHGVDGVVVLAAWGGTVARSLVGVPASSRSSRVDDGLLGRCSGGILPWMMPRILASSLSSFLILSSSEFADESEEERKP